MAMKAKWSGLDEAVRNVMALGHEMAAKKVIVPALKRVARPLREEIVRTAPRSRDTRHMADTFVVVESEGQVLVGPSASRTSVGFVAPFVEFGTSKMGARAFIRPAFDAWKDGFAGAVTMELQKTFKRVAKRLAKKKAA
jgi:HK97 gp10 family phage protein